MRKNKSPEDHFYAKRNGRTVAKAPSMKKLMAKLEDRNIPYDKDVVIGSIPPSGAVCL